MVVPLPAFPTHAAERKRLCDMRDVREVLRETLRRRRREFVAGHPASQLHAYAMAMASAVLDAAGNAESVSGYLSNGWEVDALPALELAAARGLITALPHIASRGDPMRFLLWQPGDPLINGPYGAPQPPADAPEIEPHAIIAPLVGFDRNGNRIGQGGGHYDRAFEAHPSGLRIGLAWSVQEIDAIPVASWDQPLHSVITEKERIQCK